MNSEVIASLVSGTVTLGASIITAYATIKAGRDQRLRAVRPKTHKRRVYAFGTTAGVFVASTALFGFVAARKQSGYDSMEVCRSRLIQNYTRLQREIKQGMPIAFGFDESYRDLRLEPMDYLVRNEYPISVSWLVSPDSDASLCCVSRQPFSFNSNLQFTKLDRVSNPRLSILMYEGQDQKLSYSHANGYAMIITVDGRVHQVTEQTQVHFSWAEKEYRSIPAEHQRTCIANLFQLDSAKEQWARETNASALSTAKISQLVPMYLRTEPKCPDGGTYSLGTLVQKPKCSLGKRLQHTLTDPRAIE